MNLWTRYNGNNHTGWSSSLYEALVSAASAEQDPEKRARLYRRADRYLCREAAPIVVTYLSTQNIMVKPWLKGMEFNTLDLQFFKDVYIDSHRSAEQSSADSGRTGESAVKSLSLETMRFNERFQPSAKGISDNRF